MTSDAVNARAAQDFGGADYGRPSVVQPWARFLWVYQKVVYLRGMFLFLFVLVGAIGVALGVRRKTRVAGTGWGGLALLPWLTGVALLVLPPMTAGFSYRYVLAAVPAALPRRGPGLRRPRQPAHLAPRARPAQPGAARGWGCGVASGRHRSGAAAHPSRPGARGRDCRHR